MYDQTTIEKEDDHYECLDKVTRDEVIKLIEEAAPNGDYIKKGFVEEVFEMVNLEYP